MGQSKRILKVEKNNNAHKTCAWTTNGPVYQDTWTVRVQIKNVSKLGVSRRKWSAM